MKRNIIIVTMVCAIFVVSGTYGFTNYNKNTNKSVLSSKPAVSMSTASQSTNKENTFYVYSISDVAKTYGNINELYKDSNYIIQGKVTDAQVIYNESGLYTKTTIQVLEDYIGNIGVNQNINVIFQGGVLNGSTAKEYFQNIYKQKFGEESKAQLPDKVVDGVNGLENIEKGDTLILFLQDKSKESKGVDKYVLTGAYQGRFKIKDNKIELHEELNTEQNSQFLSEDKKSFNKDAFIKYLKNFVP